MTEEIINSDGTRNWQANILQDQVKRLEQENKRLCLELIELRKEFVTAAAFTKDGKPLKECLNAYKYKSALEEIKTLCNKGAGVYTNAKVVGIINEVLQWKTY